MADKYKATTDTPRRQKVKVALEQPKSQKVKVKDVVRSDTTLEVWDGGTF